MSGKGDRIRPKTVPQETWAKNYEEIFKKDKKQENTDKNEQEN